MVHVDIVRKNNVLATVILLTSARTQIKPGQPKTPSNVFYLPGHRPHVSGVKTDSFVYPVINEQQNKVSPNQHHNLPSLVLDPLHFTYKLTLYLV